MFCSVGTYQEVCISGENQCHNSGYTEGNMSHETMVYLECDNCGNSQRFKLRLGGHVWFPNAFKKMQARH